MARRSTLALPFAYLLALAACDNGAPPAIDGGTDAASLPDATYRAPDSCDMTHLHTLDGMAGGTVSIDLDTTMTTTRPRDLGPGCGNTASDIRWAPQEVIEFHVPGTGMQGVRFTTDAAATSPINLNTLIQVREGECRMIPAGAFPPTCFDDVDPATNLHSTGGITVMGGTTLYFIVTGYSNPPAGQMAVSEGTIHVDFSVAPNTPPTITAGTVLFSGVDTKITATATDAEGPIAGYAMQLYNAAGGIDTNGDGTFSDADSFVFTFDTVDNTAPTYRGHSLISGMVYRFAEACRQAGVLCTQFGLRVFDQQYALSAELRVNVQEAQYVGVGATCDESHLCVGGLSCSGGSCGAVPAASTECGGAMDIVLATPTTASTTMTVSGSTPASGVFVGSCGGGMGGEGIWHLAVPAGDYDLSLTTDVGGTAVDTLVYVRRACLDQTTELAMGCNDDINYPSNPRSHLTFRDITPGDYYIFVETYDGAPGAYHLQATLLPVLASGTACDPSMVNYRCVTGVCGATSHVCP